MTLRREKRQCRRVRFADPLPASLSKRLVRLLDLSTLGARIEHPFPLQLGRRRTLEFECEGEPLVLDAEVIRSRLESAVLGPPVFRTGLRFTSADPESSALLWAFIASMAIEELELATSTE